MTDLRGQTEEQALKEAIDRAIQNVRTNVPGKIVSFDPETQMAVVQPLIRRYVTIDDEQTTIDMPEIVQVPIIQPRSGGFALTMPVTAGDQVMLAVQDRPLDTFVDNGDFQNPQQPIAPRHHHITDSVAFLGATPMPQALREYNGGGPELRTVSRNVRITISGNNAEIVAGDTTINVQEGGRIDISAPGDVHVDGDVIISGISFLEHVHGGIVRGTQLTFPPEG